MSKAHRKTQLILLEISRFKLNHTKTLKDIKIINLNKSDIYFDSF